MLARTPRFPLVMRYRRPWRLLVPAVRGLARRGVREWEIARRLRISRRRVALALSTGAGIWTAHEVERMRAAFTRHREMGR